MDLKRLKIDQELFNMAFCRDVDFHDICETYTYLDLNSGEIIWVYADDESAYINYGVEIEDNQDLRKKIKKYSDHYLIIPGLDHGDHHEILKEFINSDWIDDENSKLNARNAYFGSIGGWLKNVSDDDAILAYNAFRDEKHEQLMEKYLIDSGIDPRW